MKTERLLPTLVFLCLFFIGKTQTNGLVIEYNFYTNEIVYTKNGEIISKPYVSKNDNIHVVIKEFNPYIYEASLNSVNLDYNQSSLMKTAFDGSSFGGSSGFGLSSLLGNFSIGGSLLSDLDLGSGSRGAESMEYLKAKSEYRSMLSDLSTAEEELKSDYTHLKNVLLTNESRELAMHDINKLKSNENIRPSRIKELIEEEIYLAFAKEKSEDIITDDVLNSDFSGKLNDARTKFESSKSKYNTMISRFKLFASTTRNNEIFEGSDLSISVDSVLKTMTENSKKMKEIKVNYTSTPQNDLKSLASLRQVYEEIQGDAFVHRFAPIQAEGDEVFLELAVQKKDNYNSGLTVKSLTQKVPVSGSWKITGGVGLNFGTFSEDLFEYRVVDNEIVANKKDAFIPIISSSAHFYKSTHRSINFGGSFGVGFPLQGGNSIQSATFFLGPTLIIGKTQRFILTTGIMGGKIERLSDGYQVGDMFEGSSETLPKFESYEMGYFIGISFNVL